MLRILSTILILSSFALSAQNYTVRVGVFKHKSNLVKVIKKFPPALRKTLRTYKRRHRTYLHTMPTSDRATLVKLLPAYRKVLKDVYISKTKLR